MPDMRIAGIDLEKAVADFNKAVKEAAYVAVGLGVLGFQRAQVQRVELTKQLETQLSALSELSSGVNSQVETYITAAREQLVEALAQLQKLPEDIIPSELPDPAAVREQLTDLAKSVDEAVAPIRRQFEDQLDRFQESLPSTARDLVSTIRGAVQSQEQTIRSVVGLA